MPARDRDGPQRGKKPVDNETLARRMDVFEDELRRNIAVCEPLAEQVDRILKTVTDLNAEIGGAPPIELRGGRRTHRERLHKIENDTAPVAIEAAVNRAIAQHSDRLWSAWQKRVVVTATVFGLLVGVLRIFGIGG